MVLWPPLRIAELGIENPFDPLPYPQQQPFDHRIAKVGLAEAGQRILDPAGALARYQPPLHAPVALVGAAPVKDQRVDVQLAEEDAHLLSPQPASSRLADLLGSVGQRGPGDPVGVTPLGQRPADRIGDDVVDTEVEPKLAALAVFGYHGNEPFITRFDAVGKWSDGYARSTSIVDMTSIFL